MGGSTDFGGMWPEQAPAELFANDAGRPTSLAGDVAFIPLHVRPELEGNTSEGDIDEPLEPPALLTIKYSKAGQRCTLALPWRPNVALKYYLQQAGLIGTRLRTALKISGRCVRMSYVPKSGDVLVMSLVDRPMS